MHEIAHPANLILARATPPLRSHRRQTLMFDDYEPSSIFRSNRLNSPCSAFVHVVAAEAVVIMRRVNGQVLVARSNLQLCRIPTRLIPSRRESTSTRCVRDPARYRVEINPSSALVSMKQCTKNAPKRSTCGKKRKTLPAFIHVSAGYSGKPLSAHDRSTLCRE